MVCRRRFACIGEVLWWSRMSSYVAVRTDVLLESTRASSVDALNDREIGIELTRAPSEAVI